MNAMLLAAGRGERMRPLTDTLAKALLEIGGETLIERNVRRLAAHGVQRLVVNLSYRGDQIRAHLGGGERFGVEIVYSDEGEPALETAGGIVQALPLLGGQDFFVVNADVVSDFDFARLDVARDLGTLVLVPNPSHHPRGDFALDARGRLVEHGPRLTFAGISRLSPELFAGFAPGRRALKPLLDAAIARGRLSAVEHCGLWIDVGTPERLAEARAVLGS